MNLFFTFWNVLIQDENFDEISEGDEFTCNLSFYDLKSILHVKRQATKLTHITNNHYEVLGFVYRIEHDVVFIEVDGMNFTIDNQYDEIEVNRYYKFNVLLTYDIWDNYGLEENLNHYNNEVSICGVIKSLKIDTSKHIQLSQKEFTRDGVEPIYDVSIKKTSCWDDEDNFADGNFNYLVEINLKNEKL